MYTLYTRDQWGAKQYFEMVNFMGATVWTIFRKATQFRTIEAANSKAHELNLSEYFIEDERGETVYPMKPEVIDPTQHEQTK